MSKDPRRIRLKAITGRALFIGRVAKALQAGAAEIPTDPPANKFKGDGATFSLSHTTGNLVVSVDVPNATGVTTEIKLQRLTESYAKPKPNGYRTKAFHAFTVSSTSVSIPVTPAATRSSSRRC